MLLSPEDLLTLRPGPQGGADGEGLWADELPADTLQALKDAGGLSSQGGFAESGRQGSLYSLALLSKAGLLSAYQQGRAAQQPTAGFLSDLELMKVFAEHSQEAEQGPLLSQLHSMAEAEGKIAGAGRAGRQASAAENILPTEEGAQAQTGQSAKAEPTLKPLASGQTNQAAVLSQVVERIVIGLRRNESRLSLQIHPPSLGKVNIDLAVRNNQLRAVIFAETAQAKMLLDANLDQLKACLESQNLDVEKVSVEVGSDDRQFASLLREQREQERRHVPASGSDLEEACQALPADNDTRVSIYDAYRGSRSTVDLFA